MENQKSSPEIQEWLFTAMDSETGGRVDGRVKATSLREAERLLTRHGFVAIINISLVNKAERWQDFFRKTKTRIAIGQPDNVKSIEQYLTEREEKKS